MKRRINSSSSKNRSLNWFDNLSKRNAEYMNSDDYKRDNEEERLRKLKENREDFDNEIELLKRNGYSVEEFFDSGGDRAEEHGFGDGRDHVDDAEDDGEDPNFVDDIF